MEKFKIKKISNGQLTAIIHLIDKSYCWWPGAMFWDDLKVRFTLLVTVYKYIVI